MHNCRNVGLRVSVGLLHDVFMARLRHMHYIGSNLLLAHCNILLELLVNDMPKRVDNALLIQIICSGSIPLLEPPSSGKVGSAATTLCYRW